MDFEVLGELGVLAGGTKVVLGGVMARRLLAALLVDAPRPVSRDALVERLWGESPPPTAATALQVHVSNLRRVLEPDRHRGDASLLRTAGDGYALDIERSHIDADRFESLVCEAGELVHAEPEGALANIESARELWHGRPWGALADEPWLHADVARLEEVRRRADELWADAELALGRHEHVVDALARAVASEPLREHRWEQLMTALYRCGRQADALRAFQEARHILTEELGIEPSPSLRALEQAVLVQDPRLDAPTRVVPARPRHNLPAALTMLVGRDDEVATTRKRLEASRVVTITGSGGCGKTRLALAVAERLVDRYDGGVWFVDLTAAPTADVVSTQIATDLGLREGDAHGPQGPLALLCTYLRDRELLLVLDNCEHVAAETATVVGALLGACPGLRLLATSQVVLGLVGETVETVSPLETPEAGASLDELVASPAVELFLQRSGDRGPAHDRNLTAIGELCRFLDGVPLAIELAATWTDTLSPAEILERLAGRLSLAAADDLLPERQRALRTTIEWSHGLLGDAERVAFRRLSVYPAGFTLAGAAAVIAGDPAAMDGVTGRVARLVGSSLVRTDQRAVPARYRMLEAIREYATERLRDSGEEDEVRIRQLDYFVDLARSVRREELFGPPVPRVMAALDAEHDNIRDLLARLVADRDGERSVVLAGAMGTYWTERGHWGEGQRWITAALELTTGSRTLERARALIALAQTTSSFGGIASRVDELEEAVEICREHDARGPLTVALMYLSLGRGWRRELPLMRAASLEAKQSAAGLKSTWIDTAIGVYDSLALVLEGDLQGAHAGLVRSASALLGLGDESLGARTLMYAGNVSTMLGDLTAARNELTRSMDLTRRHGIHGTYAHGMVALAQVAMQLGDAEAPSRFDDCLDALEMIGDARCTGVCQRSLGSIALDAGRIDEAVDRLRQSLDALATYDQRSLAIAIADLATIYQRRGETADAARLAFAAQCLAERPGMPLNAFDRARIDAAISATGVGDAMAADETLDLDAILEVARRG